MPQLSLGEKKTFAVVICDIYVSPSDEDCCILSDLNWSHAHSLVYGKITGIGV